MPDFSVIVDTGPLVAFLVEEDEHHDWAVSEFQRLPPPFLTCEPVLTEAFFLVSRNSGGSDRFGRLLRSELLRVEFPMMRERAAVTDLVRKYASVPMSLADACLVRMSELVDGSAVLTVDGGFRVYRRHGRSPISVIMP